MVAEQAESGAVGIGADGAGEGAEAQATMGMGVEAQVTMGALLAMLQQQQQVLQQQQTQHDWNQRIMEMFGGRSGGGEDRGGKGGGGERKRLMEGKEYMRVDKFGGGEEEFAMWKEEVEVITRAIDQDVETMMKNVERRRLEVTGQGLEEGDVDGSYEGFGKKGRQLYEVLFGITTGEAKVFIRDAGGATGSLLGISSTRRTTSSPSVGCCACTAR